MTTAVSPGSLHPARKPDREDDENRFYDGVAFASNRYIRWIVGSLRIGKIDASRMKTSGVPILRAHQSDSVVGAVTRIEKDGGGIWRAGWRLPKKPFNRDTFDAMDSAVLRGVSIGANIVWSTLTLDNPDETNFDNAEWTCDVLMVEQSIVATPADTSSGIDRSLSAVLERDGALFDTVISPEGIATLETPATLQRLQSLVQQHNETISALRREEQQTMTTPTISPDALERAVNERLAADTASKQLTDLVTRVDKLVTDGEVETKNNMEFRAKVNQVQFGGASVLQMSNWGPMDSPLDLGKIIRLTSVDDLGFPPLERSGSSLEESFLEQQALEPAGRSTLARIPFAAIEARERQLQLQRNTVAGGAGARPLNIHILGDGGLLLNAFNPILGAMNVRSGLSGAQKQPYWTAQGSAAGGAEATDITISTWTLDDTELLPVSIGSAFDISSSLRAADDLTFEALVYMSIQAVAGDELVKQVLNGGGPSANEIAGLWGRVSTATPDQVHEYGAAQTDHSRQDILAVKNLVDLQKTDGGPGQFILSTTMWQLCESTLRGGAASDAYLLEAMMDGMGMGMMEGRAAYHYRDFSPAGIVDAGLFAKLQRCTIFLWNNSFLLEEVPVLARKTQYKLVVQQF